MSDTFRQESAAKTVRTLQIIVFAMLTGLTMFMVVTIFVAPTDTCIFPSITILGAAAFLLAVVGMVARSFALHVLTTRARRGIIDGTYPSFGGDPFAKQVQAADSEGADRNVRYLLTMYQIKTIVGVAFCEGFALFALVVFSRRGELPQPRAGRVADALFGHAISDNRPRPQLG